MPTPATRLITLILLLQRQPNQKARDLASELRVSVRTLHRYFGMLDEMGIPVYSERGPYGGFSLVRVYKMPPLVFTPEEAVAVSLGAGLVGRMWGRLYQAAACSALAKLENILPDEQRREMAWANRSLVAIGLQRAETTALAFLLEELRRALRERRRVEMVYQNAGQRKSEARRLDPYALAYRWGWWYVAGFCHRRREVRTFRLDRIQSLVLLDEIFKIPENFDAGAFLNREFQGEPRVRVRMQFAPEAAPIALANRASWETLEEGQDGSILVSLTAPDANWASSMVMAFGPWVTVLEPEEVRRTVKEWAQTILAQY